MKKTAISNEEGLIPFKFNIPGDAQMLEIMVKKTQTSRFKNMPLRIPHKTTINDCEDDLLSLN